MATAATIPNPLRKFALIKVTAGDWLLPGNDGRTLWRLRTYDEEFAAEDGSIEVRPCWGVWRWADTLDTPSAIESCEVDDEDQWTFFAGHEDSRSAAIDTALKAAP